MEQEGRGRQDPEERPEAALDLPPALGQDEQPVEHEVAGGQPVSGSHGNAEQELVENAGEEEGGEDARRASPPAGDGTEDEVPRHGVEGQVPAAAPELPERAGGGGV